MDRRVAATVFVVVLFSLAGCSALPVFDGEPSTPTSATTPGASTPTSAPDTTSTTVPVMFPEGYGPSGVVDADAAVANHNRTLTGYGSYRFRFDVGIGNGTGTRDAFVYLLRADHDAATALEIRDDGDTTRSHYYETDRIYVRVEAGDGPRHNSTAFEYTPHRLTGIQFIAPLFDQVEYGGATVRDTDNGTIYRYRSRTVTNPGAILPTDTTAEEIDSFDVELFVHEDGYVRFARYTVVTEDGTELAAIARIDNVNDTTVDRPSWYDRAADG